MGLHLHEIHLEKSTDSHLHSKHISAVKLNEDRERTAGRLETDKNPNTQVCFDVEGISVVYSKAFQGLLRLSTCFLPLFSFFLNTIF